MRRTCGKCGAEYTSYTVLVADDPAALTAHARIENEYEHVCPACRSEIAPMHCICDTDGEDRCDARDVQARIDAGVEEALRGEFVTFEEAKEAFRNNGGEDR